MAINLQDFHRGDPCPLLSNYMPNSASQTVDGDSDASMEDQENGWEDVNMGFVGDRMRFVDVTGIFLRRVRWCCCPGKDGNLVSPDLQLLDAWIYPATSDKPTTAFTFNVLEEFALDSLECKTAALTFLSKLRRMTNPMIPLSTPNVYPAFMRCYRQYQNLKNLLWAGIAHDSEHARTSGDLVLFCVICPQIGKNVSVEEMEASNNP
ncbi:hypothetical protein MVEN_00078900 [Mycena venus]|uniref:CxC2-like cysteine cluster KDZ transposase-associated domain-containing protein n=1 Tax=Mycena venus TaxID=2733690 RepID=A0A8H6Z8C7_9AGAR|nr:hypothetical protein MVEN_00078900 [Mycena venus]